MGFICKNSRSFNYGEEFENCYAKIEEVGYDYREDFWNCNVDFYASQKAREYRKMIEICQTLSWDTTRPKGDMSRLPPFHWKEKPAKYNENQWMKIQLYSIKPYPRLLFKYSFGVRAPIVGEIKREDVIRVLYEKLIEQHESSAISVTVDKTDDEIIGEYLAKDLPELKNPDPEFFNN